MKAEEDLLNWPMPFMSKKEVSTATTRSKSSIYNDVCEGVFVPPLKIGGRRVVYLATEVNQIMNCWVKGYTKEQIKEVVQQLINGRAK